MLKMGSLCGKNRKDVYRYCGVFFGIFAIVMMVVGVISFLTSDFYTDVEETDITIIDKWIEGDRYYFASEEGNVYQMIYDRNHKLTYNSSLGARYKNLAVGKEYTITFFCFMGIDRGKRNSLSEVRK